VNTEPGGPVRHVIRTGECLKADQVSTIRADNIGGLAFYSALGFEDNGIHRAVPLRDGTPIDRVSKRYVL
jgi:hypothetical protein